VFSQTVQNLTKTSKSMQKIQKIKPPLLRIMKYSLLQLFLACVFSTISIASGYTQELLNRTVSLKVDNRIQKCPKQSRKEADVKFVYSSRAVQMDRKVSVHVTEKRLSEVLDMVLHPMQLNYQVVGGQIIINSQDVKIPESEVAEVQTIKDQTVKGKVADENGAGLPGVNVFIKGTKRVLAQTEMESSRLAFPKVTLLCLCLALLGMLVRKLR
jgi:hypothetical protein